MYVLIPSEQCGGCFYYDASTLSKMVNDNIIVIKAHPKAKILNFNHVILDKENAMYHLKFLNHTNRIVVFRNQILSYASIYDITKQLDSTYNCLQE